MAGELQQIVSSEITIMDVTDGSTLITYFTNNKHGSLNFSYDPDSGTYTPEWPRLENEGDSLPLVIKPHCYRSVDPRNQLIHGGIVTEGDNVNEFYTSSSTENYKWFIDGTKLMWAEVPDATLVEIEAGKSVKVKSCISPGYESVKFDGTHLIVFRNSNIVSPNKTNCGISFGFDYLDPVFEGVLDDDGNLLPGVPVELVTTITLNKQGIGRNYIDMYCTPSNFFYNATDDEIIEVHADAYKGGEKQDRPGLLPGEMKWGYTDTGQTGKIVKSFWWYYDDIDNKFLPLNVAGDGVGDVTTERENNSYYEPTTDINQGETDDLNSEGVVSTSTFDVLMIREKIVYGSEIFQYACRFTDVPSKEYRATQTVIDYTDPVVVTIESDSGTVFKYGANNNKSIRAVVKEKESSSSPSAGEYIELSDAQAMKKYDFKWVLFDRNGEWLNSEAPKQGGLSDYKSYRWVSGVLSSVTYTGDDVFTVNEIYNNSKCVISRADVNVTGNLRVSVQKKQTNTATLRSYLKL